MKKRRVSLLLNLIKRNKTKVELYTRWLFHCGLFQLAFAIGDIWFKGYTTITPVSFLIGTNLCALIFYRFRKPLRLSTSEQEEAILKENEDKNKNKKTNSNH